MVAFADRLEIAWTTQPLDPSPVWSDVSAYLLPPEISANNHGRPDEFTDTSPTVLTFTLDNTDGRFTRFRAASPLYPNVRNGRRIRWTRVFILRNWVTNPTFDVDTSGWVVGGSVPPVLTRTTSMTHSGAGAGLITWGTGGTFPQIATTLTDLTIGKTYTASAWVNAPATNPALKLVIGGIGIGSPSTITGAYQQITLTFVATATTHSLQVWPDTSPTSGQTGRVDDIQVEEGSVATTFDGTPPLVSIRFDGHVNEFPTTWDAPLGQYVPATITATDRMKRFGRPGTLRSMLEEEILRDTVAAFGTGSAYYPLSEPTGATSAASITASPQGPAALTQAGSGGTLEFAQGTGPGTDDLSAPVLTPASPTAGKYLLAPLGTPVGFFGITLEAWIRTATTSTVSRTVAVVYDGSGNATMLSINEFGEAEAAGARAAGKETYAIAWASNNVGDGRTHHLVVTESISGTTVTVRLYVDGIQRSTTTFTSTALPAYRYLGIGWWKSNPSGYGIFNGTLAHVAAHSGALAAGRIADHFNAGSNGLAGERTDQRIGRIADWANLPTADRALDVGDSTVGAQSTSGQQPADVARQVAATESGIVFFGRSGLLTFHNRSRRYNQTPVFTLDAAAGHLADELDFPGDDFALTNDFSVTRAGAATARALDQASIDEHGLYRDTAEIVAATDTQAQAAADWRVNTYGDLRVRVPQVTVDVVNLALQSPTLAAAVIAADLSTKLRLANLPAAAPAATVDLFVEGYSETASLGHWLIGFNCSPGDVGDVWQLGVAGYSELGVTTRLGQ
jgi:hypothetical protein